MAIYTGSIYNNTLKDNIIQYINLNKLNNTYSVYNISPNISGSSPNVNITTIYISNGIFKFNEIQTTELETINGQLIVSGSGSQTIYYQRVFSSGLNNWSYYKTIGSINQNPNSQDTIPPYSGSILCHEVIGRLES